MMLGHATVGCRLSQTSDDDKAQLTLVVCVRVQLSLAYINVFSSCLMKYKTCNDALPPAPLNFVALGAHTFLETSHS